MAEMSKIGEMYVGACKDAYKPVEDAVTKAAKNRLSGFNVLVRPRDPWLDSGLFWF